MPISPGEYAAAVSGWKQAVRLLNEQQKAWDEMMKWLNQWKAEGRLPNDPVLAEQFYNDIERPFRWGAKYVEAMRQSGAIEP